MWNLCFSLPNYQKRKKRKAHPMKAVITTIFAAGLIVSTLSSCKHKGAACDAYQGSTRSVKKKHHSEVVRVTKTFKA
jgi:hypothetical protein